MIQDGEVAQEILRKRRTMWGVPTCLSMIWGLFTHACLNLGRCEAFCCVGEPEWPLLRSKALRASHGLPHEYDTQYESHIAKTILLQSQATEGENIRGLNHCAGDVNKYLPR